MQNNNTIKLLNILVVYASIALFFYFKVYAILAISVVTTIMVIYLNKKQWKQHLIFIGGLILVIGFSLLMPYTYKLKDLFNLIDKNCYSLRNSMANYLSASYSENTSIFIKMLLLNIKNYNSDIYDGINELNIAHLFVVSGIHINLFCLAISKLIKNKIVSNIIMMSFCLFIFYLTGFSISILRVFIYLIVKLIFKNDKYNSLSKTSITGLIILFIFIKDACSFSFILSMISSLFIAYINDNVKNNYIKITIITVTTNLILSPIIIGFNHQFNLLSFLNGFVLSYPILFLFYFELIMCWIPFMFSINDKLIHWVSDLLYKLSLEQNVIDVSISNNITVIIYFLILSSFDLSYLYKQKQINFTISKNINNK